MNLIDRDKLIKRHIPNRGNPDMNKSKEWNFFYGYASAIAAVGEVVRDMPTENRYAHWVEETDRTNHWHCSACGKVQGVACMAMNFCPECGAEMRGDENETD